MRNVKWDFWYAKCIDDNIDKTTRNHIVVVVALLFDFDVWAPILRFNYKNLDSLAGIRISFRTPELAINGERLLNYSAIKWKILHYVVILAFKRVQSLKHSGTCMLLLAIMHSLFDTLHHIHLFQIIWNRLLKLNSKAFFLD